MSKGSRRVRIFSALEVANICGVVNQTAINWIRNGHLKAFSTPGGQYRIYAKDLAAFLDKRGMSASGEVLHDLIDRENWNSILIAAESSYNEYLKEEIIRLFPEYIFFQAFDWFETGRSMTENRPGFVLLDAEQFHGVDYSRFIHTVRNDVFFGKPYIALIIGGHMYDEFQHIQADTLLVKPVEFDKVETAVKSISRPQDTAANF
ncbi:MAG: helix-turn-helix domain-containing protein [Treponema sp.]|nr:helix-turn-helix domain-containing protein [Treponema sp.]